MKPTSLSRRDFLVTSACLVLGSAALKQAMADSRKNDKPPLKPKYDEVVCPWTPEHPRHDHQLIFPLNDDELMFVWCEYYTKGEPQETKKGQGGIGDEVACQISAMTSSDGGRTWKNRRVLQENHWKHNVKHPNLVRLSAEEVLFTYVGWDSPENRNVYLRRSTDNCQSFGEQQQISEPGWYCNNADRAIRLSSGRVILPAHGPYAENYIGGQAYKGGNLHSFVWYSDDGFRTWKRSSDSMTAKGRGCHEPTIVELTDGRLYCLLRNTNQK
ncbi:MAG: exo-alpha-sialidase, partial [Planctomycetaceae bacterium]|nr:exo-alpha-sialidase [Planctomycetaceae bacterium]